jgi:hypothetical protein
VRVNSERTIEGRKPVKVHGQAESIEVADPTLVKSDGGAAVIVDITNTGTEPVSDLPIIVGVEDKGKREPINVRKELPYFQTHLPAIGAGQTLTWVYAANKLESAGSDAYAEVGQAPSPPVTSISSLPTVDVGTPTASPDDPSKVQVSVSNDIGFTQYELPVYVWATKGDRYTAGAFASAGDLEDGEFEDMTFDLIGDAKDAELHVSAPPTIYQ